MLTKNRNTTLGLGFLVWKFSLLLVVWFVVWFVVDFLLIDDEKGVISFFDGVDNKKYQRGSVVLSRGNYAL